MVRISVFEHVAAEAAFVTAWRELRAGTGAVLLRSRSEQAEFRFVEWVPEDAPPPGLPARAHSARYEVVVDDLDQAAAFAVVWVNPYEIPLEEEDDGFVEAWTRVRDTVSGRDGYVGSRLHRALDPDARFRFVNIAPWSDVERFTAAVATPVFAEAAKTIFHQAHPSLYDVLER